MSKRLLFIADTQCKPNIDLDYLRWMGEYIVDKRPDIIVHAGDHWDYESLSTYDKGKASAEGRRYKDDVEAGNKGMDSLLAPLKALQEKQKLNKKKVYNPRMVFTLGNHENRADRFANDNPELKDFIGSECLNISKWGWEVVPFLTPIEIEGIYFSHYFANPMTGKPYGGSALNLLKTIGKSFMMGHRQVLDIAMRPTIDGKQQIGIIAGAAYVHQEDYKGVVGNNHPRGIVMLNELSDGWAMPVPVSMDYLEKRYGEKK